MNMVFAVKPEPLFLLMSKSEGSGGKLPSEAPRCDHAPEHRARVRLRNGEQDKPYASEMCLNCGHLFHLMPFSDAPQAEIIRPEEERGKGTLTKATPALEWLWPGRHYETSDSLLKAVILEKATPPGHRWITVHPHKDPEEPGYPVLIKEHSDGTGTVVGGVGGALTGLRMTRLRSPEQLSVDRRKRQQERTEKRRAARESMSPEQYESHASELQKLEDFRADIQDEKIKLAQDLGLIGRGPELTDQERANLTPQEARQVLNARRQKVARAADKAFSEIKERLAQQDPLRAAALRSELMGEQQHAVEMALTTVLGSEAASHAARILGETYDDLVTPEVKRDQMAVGETLQERATANGLTPEVQAAATTEADLASADWMVQAGYADSREDALAKREEAKQKARERLGRSEKVKELTESLEVAEPENGIEHKKDILAQLGAVKAKEKALQAAKRKLLDWDPTIDQPLPSGVALTYQHLAGKGGWERDAHGRILPTGTTVEQLQAQVEQDLQMRRQTETAVKFFDVAEELGDRRQRPLREALGDAHYGALNNISQQLGGVFPELAGLELGIDRVALGALGVQGAAHAVAAWVREKLPASAQGRLRETLQQYHAETQVGVQEEALGASDRLHKEAEALREQYLPVPENAEEMTAEDVAAHLNNQWVDTQIAAKTLEARQTLIEATGHMEALGALNYALMHDATPQTVDIPLGKVGAARAMEMAYAAGLRRTEETLPLSDARVDFQHVSDGVNDFLRVKGERLGELYRETDPELMRRFDTMKEIAMGEHDEEGWLPHGVVDKTGEYTPPEDRVRDIEFMHPMTLSKGMGADQVKEAVFDYMMGAWDHYQPLELQNQLLSADFKTEALGPIGSEKRAALEPLYDRAVLEHFPQGTDPEKRGEELAAQLDGWRTDWLKKTGQVSEDFESSTIATDEATDSLVTRILARKPHLCAAYMSLRGKHGGDVKATLQQYFYQHVHGGHAPDSPEGLEDRRRRFLQGAQARYERIAARQAGAEQTGSLFGEEEPAAPARPSPEQVQQELGQVRREKAEIAERAKAGLRARRRIEVIHTALAEAGGEGPVRKKLEKELIKQARIASDHEGDLGRWDELTAREGAPDQENTLLHYQHLDEEDAWALSVQSGEARGVQLEGGRLALAPDFAPSWEDLGEDSPWEEFVSCFEGSGEQQTGRAYRNIQAHLRDEFNREFVNEYAQDRGRDLNQGRRQMPDAEDWLMARADDQTRQAHRAARREGRAQEYAWLRKRIGGKFAAEGAGAVVAKFQAQERTRGSQQLRVIDPTAIAAPQRDRLYLGEKVEQALQDQVFARVGPDFVRARGKAGAGVKMPEQEVRMDGPFIGQQRAIKALDKLGRVGANHHVGSGKSLMGLAGFTHLHGQGKANAGLFVLPTSAVGAFTGDKVRYIDPQYRMFADPTADAKTRRAAYGDADTHMVLVTQEALREDLSWAIAKHRLARGQEPTPRQVEDAKAWIRTAPMQDLQGALDGALTAEGWGRFDYLMLDEAHQALNREGKEDSLLARLTDAYSRRVPYMMSASAHPVKNDMSEAYDYLQKMDAERFPHRDTPEGREKYADFNRRYRHDPQGARRLIAAYSLAEPVKRKHEVHTRNHDLSPHPEQAKMYAATEKTYKSAQAKLKAGDMEAVVSLVEEMDPGYFERKGVAEEGRMEWAQEHMNQARLHGALSARLDQIVNAWDMEANPKMQQLLREVLEPQGENVAGADGRPQTAAPPTVVFAEHLEVVDKIHKHLQGLGYRVGKLDGSMAQPEREQLRKAFEGEGRPEPELDVLVMSDAGSQAMNLPRAEHIYHWDTPWTPKGFEQRNGRGDRANRRGDLQVHHARLRVPHEANRLRVMGGKQDISDAMRKAYETLDDTGGLREHMLQREARLGALERLEGGARDSHMAMAAGT